ncbi:MAG: hypothetical protein GXO14_06645 [Thermococci archaeon]|nr:hypothetical protein [Thermococci archaeon]
MTTVMMGDVDSFVTEILRYYREVWEIPESKLLSDPDMIIEDSRKRKSLRISFVELEDGEPVGVVYGVYATPVEST